MILASYFILHVEANVHTMPDLL